MGSCGVVTIVDLEDSVHASILHIRLRLPYIR